MGWVNRRRDHGNLIFLDVRDRSGIAQVVLDKELVPEGHLKGEQVRPEYVVAAVGKVALRDQDAINPKMPTGEIEIEATELRVLNDTRLAPFSPSEEAIQNEETRLKYRYIDLRRQEMQRNFRLRHEITRAIRESLSNQGFLEIETPILTKSTPEGARDFLVPSRVHPGEFYALPQSPQIFKQILMISGFDRYFQLARCFRDEDQRADRQLEFTQVDLEMSFIEREDIYALIEGLLKRVWKTALNLDIPTPFKRLTFQEAINRYGIDKPDTRFGMELVDFTEEFRSSTFKLFKEAVANQGVVKAINAKGLAGATQGQIDAMTEHAKSFGAKGLAFIKMENGEWKSPIVKFFSEAEKAALTKKAAIEEGDLILFAADQWLTACEILGKIRLYCGELLRSQGRLSLAADRFGF